MGFEPTAEPVDTYAVKYSGQGGHGGDDDDDDGGNDALKGDDGLGSDGAAADHHSFADDVEDHTTMTSDHVASEAHPVPYNPFLYSGALVVSSLVGRGHDEKLRRLFHDSASRFMHLQSSVKDMAGGLPIGFNKPAFLSLKQRGLKVGAPVRRVCQCRVCRGWCVWGCARHCTRV